MESFGPPVSVSAGASDSVLLRLSKRLVTQPVCGSIFTTHKFVLQRVRGAFYCGGLRHWPFLSREHSRSRSQVRERWLRTSKRARCVSLIDVSATATATIFPEESRHSICSASAGKLHLDFDHFLPLPRQGVKDHHRYARLPEY